jgi:glycosyltransferase involved in cell wall biosynthesis
MKVAIGVPTFNRRHMVELSAASLRSSSIPHGTTLLVVDDASTDYDVAYLKSIYPEFADIRRRSTNSGGASFACRDLMRQLLETDAEALLVLDSDLLVSTNFLATGISLLPETDGVLSLFNTPNHPVIGARGRFVLKKSLGSAGTLWRRDVAAKVFGAVPADPEWDWRFSEFLVGAGIEICVTRDSLVQHVGYADGQHCNFLSGDWGVGFAESDARNAYRFAEVQLADSQARFRVLQEQIDTLSSRIYRVERRLLLPRLARAVRRLFGRPVG